MSDSALLLTVRLLDGRYHGEGDWPPSPFRLFQALVAGGQLGRDATAQELGALHWLESLGPPVIAAPKARRAANTKSYVPHNVGDAFGGDLAKARTRREAKHSRPYLFDLDVPFLYLWSARDHQDHFTSIHSLTERLYQFGRGIDLAYATADCIGMDEAQERLRAHPGTLHRPTPGGAGSSLRCPLRQQSLDSLLRRHAAQLQSIQGGLFRQAPAPIFADVAYDCPPLRLFFDIESVAEGGKFAPQPLVGIARLTETIRGHLASRLHAYHPKYVETLIVGRAANEADKAQRIRIIPLPSIGHHHADQDIRRVLIEVPPNCPIPLADIQWAASGLNLTLDLQTGEMPEDGGSLFVPATQQVMAKHYGIGPTDTDMARLWRTVTPVVLPRLAAGGGRSGQAPTDYGDRAVLAIRQALRHAGLEDAAEVVRIQREPLASGGAFAGDFASGPRFTASRLRHVELRFDRPVSGPILIGDGRYCGLGLFHPVADACRDLIMLPLLPNNRPPARLLADFLGAVRRALMALDRDLESARPAGPGRLFSGHEVDGSPVRSGRHHHVFLAGDDGDGDDLIDRLWIIAPWRADMSASQVSSVQIKHFERVATALNRVMAGKLGVFHFGPPGAVSEDDPMTGRVRRWISRTPYTPTRYPKAKLGLDEQLRQDLRRECVRRGFPEPEVEIIETLHGPRSGLRVRARICFAVVVAGPLLLGRDSHAGGGLFVTDGGV